MDNKERELIDLSTEKRSPLFSLFFSEGGIFMTYKQIEASRELRLWIGQIIVPAITLAATTLAIPEVRQAVAAKANEIKYRINQKIKRNRA
jgi:hypothetical protein